MVKTSKTNQAFTLVELSIVLLIIGLVIGGISAGSALIKQANLRSVISEFNNIQISTNAFILQYSALPGDFANAGAFWPSATCVNSSVDTGCNGNGNGLVETDYSNGNEAYRYWQHLSLAGIVNGIYVGTRNAVDQYPTKYSSVGRYGVRYVNAWSSMPQANMMEYGIWEMISGYPCACLGLLTTLDTYNIDAKIDDGIAKSGKMMAIDPDYASSGSCSSSYSSTPADYNLSSANSGSTCHILKSLQ